MEVADALSFSVDESNGSGILEEQKTGGNVDWEAEEASLALARQLMEEEVRESHSLDMNSHFSLFLSSHRFFLFSPIRV